MRSSASGSEFSTSVIARASARRSPARTPATRPSGVQSARAMREVSQTRRPALQCRRFCARPLTGELAADDLALQREQPARPLTELAQAVVLRAPGRAAGVEPVAGVLERVPVPDLVQRALPAP